MPVGSMSPGASSTAPTPSPAVGDLAGLLAEIRTFTPERLAEIEAAVKAYHEARQEAGKIVELICLYVKGLTTNRMGRNF